MISYLEGKIIYKGPRHIILLTNGVGYKISATDGYIKSINQEDDAEVFTHLNVKEDALELYGFKTREELELFELLITISGVGPRAGLAIVAMDSPDAIAGAILNEDAKYMTQVSGIGLKTAQKIVIELQDKVAKLSFEPEEKKSIVDSDVVSALETLGYASRDVREVLRHISKDIESVEGRVKEALKILGNK